MPTTLVEAIDVLLEANSTDSQCLVGQQEALAIKTLAAQIAPVLRGGFECRLSAGDRRVDLQQCILGNEQELTLVNEMITTALLACEATGQKREQAGWLRLQSFIAEWADPESLLRSHITEVWLEFDIEPNAGERPSPLPLPAVFFGLAQPDSASAKAYQIAERSLDLLIGRSAWAPWQDSLQRCFTACVGEAFVSHIGVMLSRTLPALRVNVKRLQPNSLTTYLQQIDWTGDIASAQALIAKLFSWVDRTTVCVDVGKIVFPKIGLECMILNQPLYESRWADFLTGLVSLNLCEPAKRQAVLDWSGQIHPLNASTPWPSSLISASLLQPVDRFTAFNRRISHIKVSWQPQRPLEAKAYLWFQHSWLSTGKSK